MQKVEKISGINISHVEGDCQINAKVCFSPTIRLNIGGQFTVLGAIGPVSVSRYMARLRATGADLGTGRE